jgi:hypothetical protein
LYVPTVSVYPSATEIVAAFHVSPSLEYMSGEPPASSEAATNPPDPAVTDENSGGGGSFRVV